MRRQVAGAWPVENRVSTTCWKVHQLLMDYVFQHMRRLQCRSYHWLRRARKDLRRETKIMFHFVSLDRGRAEVGMILMLRKIPQHQDQQERRTMEFNALLSEVMDYVFQHMMMLSSLAFGGREILSYRQITLS
jgi:hypothetical protein